MKIIIIFSFVYLTIENLINERQKRKENIVISGDKGSIWVTITLIIIGNLLSFSIAATNIGRIYYWETFLLIGIIFTTIGLIIRIGSIMTLKDFYTYTVTKIEKHELVETGLYKRIRHPAYLGQLIVFIGISISTSNWLSIVLMIASILPGYMYRIKVEESFMVEHFGQRYLDYQKRTKRWIPGII